MNAAALAKYYCKLTAEERCALSLAAWTRGDDVESDRLARAAPRLSCSVSADKPQMVAFHQIGCMHLLELLDLAAQICQRLLWKATSGDGADTHVVRLSVQFRVQLDGWRQFCTELGIDGDALWQKMQMPGLMMVALIDSATASVDGETRPPEEMVTMTVEGSDEPLTADLVARELRSDWRALAGVWKVERPDAASHQR